jgi:threonine synthase
MLPLSTNKVAPFLNKINRKPMQYYSTKNRSIKADFRQATLQGQPSDKGLYFPEQVQILPRKFFEDIRNLSKEQIAFEVIKPYVGNAIDEASLEKIIAETVAFDFPLVRITDSISTLELFHGPTLAFKDVGARFMSRCLGYFSQEANRKTTVLVATSGDTGGAVANAFYNVENVDVVILYPSGKVSDVQERQLTTLGNNITALEIDGTFDDCQQMVKEAFADEALNERIFLTSANSINVARWLPQQFYYFYAYQQWMDEEPPVIAVPSGNFGNICAGILAHISGLPVKHFVAACNANDVVSHYLQHREIVPKTSVPTLSNAMDVGNPSNFIRILEIFQHEYTSVKNILSSYSISDSETIRVMQEVRNRYNYLLDPHGAVGFASLKKYLNEQKEVKGYFLETAHPVKFDVESIIKEKVDLPKSVRTLFGKQKQRLQMKADTGTLKEYLMDKNQTR